MQNSFCLVPVVIEIELTTLRIIPIIQYFKSLRDSSAKTKQMKEESKSTGKPWYSTNPVRSLVGSATAAAYMRNGTNPLVQATKLAAAGYLTTQAQDITSEIKNWATETRDTLRMGSQLLAEAWGHGEERHIDFESRDVRSCGRPKL